MLKQPKKLKREFKEVVSAYYLNPDDWMLKEELEFYIVIIRKDTVGTSKPITKRLDKFRKKKVIF